MRFEVGEGQVGEVVHDRKAFFLGGLAPTRTVDVAEFCPNGAVAVGEESTFGDGVLSFITLSIYTPRSSTYYCAAKDNERAYRFGSSPLHGIDLLLPHALRELLAAEPESCADGRVRRARAQSIGLATLLPLRLGRSEERRVGT